MRSSPFVGVCLVALASPAAADVVEVPGDYPTLQSAIWGVHSGDTILVAAGTYHESLETLGKNVTLESVAGPEETVIDATGLHGRVLTATAVSGAPTLRLTGFTLTGGRTSGDHSGAGVFVGSNVTAYFVDCVIRDNVFDDTGPGEGYGGGLAVDGVAVLTGCEVRDNHVHGEGAGGGVATLTGAIQMTGCVIAGNSAGRGGGAWGAGVEKCTIEDNVADTDGGGLGKGWCFSTTFRGNTAGQRGGGFFGELPLGNCAFLGNSAGTGGGAYGQIVADWFFEFAVSNCIFAHNEASLADGVFGDTTPALGLPVAFCSLVGDSVYSTDGLSVGNTIARDVPAGQAFVSLAGAPVEVAWSDVSGGWPGPGNFDALPLFVNAAAGNYHLSLQSPCIDAGDPAYPADAYPWWDMDGQARVMNFRVDLGADEAEGDCNQNGIGDLHDIAHGLSTDCDGDSVPDECEELPDCNANGIPDLCDLASGTSADCNHNGQPDECEPLRDCNGNGVPDGCDIAAHSSTDCDLDSVPDECQPLVDCNGNGVQDACDFLAGDSHDCNANGLPDECDIAAGTSIDLNFNGWPDECEDVLQVPGDHATLQAAIDAAASGDAIQLAAGNYAGPGNTKLNLHGKQLTIEGPAAGACVIDGGSTTNFLRAAGSHEKIWLRRLTIRHMKGQSGSALQVEFGAAADVRDCAFENCQATLGGGAISAATGSSLFVRACTFTANKAQRGGALRAVKSTASIERATFTANVAIFNGGALSVGNDGKAAVRDSIFRHNSGGFSTELHVEPGADLLAVAFSDVQGGFGAVGGPSTAMVEWGPGMIDADPLFAAAPADLHLLPGSPCINTGDPAGPPDADGSPPDMGALAYEPWTALGGGIAGTFGLPVLAANGPLTGGSLLTWSVAHGWPGQAFSLVVGFAQAGLPLHGGVLWPQPQVFVGLGFDAEGAADGAGTWPAGWPAGTGVWLQAWFVDAGAVGGLAASNGVKGIAP